MGRFHFYATPKELTEFSERIVAKRNLVITRSVEVQGRHPNLAADTYASFHQVPDFGVMHAGNRMNGDNFALHSRDVVLRPHSRPFGMDGGYVTSILPTSDKRCASFWPGGAFGDNVLILSEVLSEVPTKESDSIVRAFRTAVKKISAGKARGSWVTQGARAFVAQGGLLTDYYQEGLAESRFISLDEIVC